MFYHRVLIPVLLVCLVACTAPAPTPAPTPTVTPPLYVYADASLTDALRDVRSEFSKTNADTRIEFNFTASDDMIVRLDARLSAGIAAGSDPAVFDHLAAQNRIESAPRVFARHPLAIVIARTNPKGILRLQDLNRNGLRVALAPPETRLGASSRTLIEKLQAAPRFRPNFVEQFTRAVIAQPSSGAGILNLLEQHRVDVGIVYTTEALLERNRVLALELPNQFNTADDFYIAPLKSGRDAAQLQLFIDFLFTPQAQNILATYGFEPLP